MASVKLGTLIIRAIAKPISNQLKVYAQTNQPFKRFCINLAQNLWKAEIRLRESILGEVHGSVRPLNEAKAIQNGANFLAEGFLFSVGASLIIAETWRSSRSESRRREDVDDRIDELETKFGEIENILRQFSERLDDQAKISEQETARNEEMSRVLLRVVDIGLHGGWAEFEDSPIKLPRIQRERLGNLLPPSTWEDDAGEPESR